MPIFTDQITLGTAAELIVPNANMAQQVTLHNMSKAALHYVYVGNSNVSASNSIHIDPGQNLALTLQPGDELYGLSDPGGVDVGVITITKRS